MQGQGQPGEPSNLTGPMPATDDEIREKYLERAIREINHRTRDLQSCRHCPRVNLMPVLGSVKIMMRDFDGPDEFLESLRDADIIRRKQSLLYVQALKFIQTKSPAARKARTGAK